MAEASQPTAVNLLRVEERKKGRLEKSKEELVLGEGRQLLVMGERTVAFEVEAEMKESSMSPEFVDMMGLGEEEFSHVIRKLGRWHPGSEPKGKGIAMSPQLSGQPGREIGDEEEDDGMKRRCRRRKGRSGGMTINVKLEHLEVEEVSAI